MSTKRLVIASPIIRNGMVMKGMLTAEEYRKLAAQCLELAEEVSMVNRHILLNMAEVWLRHAMLASQSRNQ